MLELENFKYKNNLDEIDELLLAIMTMDILEIYSLLNEDLNFFEFSKIEFIKTIHNKFKKHQLLGDEELYLNLNECYKCHENETICEFVGLDSGIGMSLYFQLERSKLIGVSFCDCYGKIEDLSSYYNWDKLSNKI